MADQSPQDNETPPATKRTLDPDAQQALEAAQSGVASPLLDNTPLGPAASALLDESAVRPPANQTPDTPEEQDAPHVPLPFDEPPLPEASADPIGESVQPPATGTGEAAAQQAPTENAENLLSQDMLDAILAAANTEEEVVSENLAAAATTPKMDLQGLTQDDLDHIIQKAHELGLEVGPSDVDEVPAGPPPTAPAKKTPDFSGLVHKVKALRHLSKERLARLAASLFLGGLVSAGTFVYLNYSRHVPSHAPQEARVEVLELPEAMVKARALINLGDYPQAVRILEIPLEKAPASAQRLDALYLFNEARVRGFVAAPGASEYLELHASLDEMLGLDPAHARAPDGLIWKAQLYELEALHVAALDIYNRILEGYPNAPHRDTVLRDAAALCVEINRAAYAAQYAQQLLSDYPGSPLAGEARLLLGRAYEMAGLIGDARTLYVRTVEEGGHSPIANQALLHLGHLNYDRREYGQAIQVLEELLATTTTTAGNDEAFLLLARAYRATGKLEEARDTLNDLLNFLPESDITPEAYVELSQVSEELGERRQALRLAEQAAIDFPDHPQVLKNKGLLLGLAGSPFGAATTLLAAEQAGAHEPALLLAAGRHFTTAGAPDMARQAYEQLSTYYPGTVEAYQGLVEDAELLFNADQPSRAIDQLENLALTTLGHSYHTEVLLKLADLYNALGLDQPVAELAQRVAAESDAADVLGRTVLALLQAGRAEEAIALAPRVNRTALLPALQYRIESGLGRAMLAVDPRRGLEQMEAAYENFPDYRNTEDEMALLDAYLQSDRTAAARRLVMNLHQRARHQPLHTPVVIDAAIQWGDHLYAKQDYRGALDAYALAIENATQSTPPVKGLIHDPQWAEFQRANALLELSDFENSVRLLDHIAASNAPWAQDAKMKAEYVRLEQRRRGFPVTAQPDAAL